MDLREYRSRFEEDSSPGWDAIDAALANLYGGQEPKHWETEVSYLAGGPDPLDGVSAYECRDGGIDHLHFITFGYSILYFDEEAAADDVSGFGFEMTFRLRSPLPPREEPGFVLNLLQNVARYVFNSGKGFGSFHWIPANGPIRKNSGTKIVGLAFAPDPALSPIESPHGRVSFLQAFGLTQSELDQLESKATTCEQIVEQHRRANPLLVTDLSRQDR